MNQQPIPKNWLISSKSSPLATPSSSLDQTANWKAYTNEKWKWQIKYPNNWKQEDCSETVQIKDKLVLVESVCLYGQDYKLEPDRLIGQRITITSEKIGEKSREPATQCTGKSGPGVVCEEVTVDGKPAIIAGLPGAGITESEVIEATLLASAVQKGEKLIRLDTEYTDCLIWGSVTKLCTDRNIAIDTFKQILSTFKFE